MLLRRPEPEQLGQGEGSQSPQTCTLAGFSWGAEAVQGV